MSSLNQLRELIKAAKSQKEAGSPKSAFAGADSSHPTDKQDDGTMPVKEGPRGSEHEKDLKTVPGPNNVNTAPEAKPDEQNSLQMNIGLSSKTVGSDPTNEKPDRMKPEDTQATTHPADAEKMAAADLHQLFSSNANGLLAKIAAGGQPQTPPATGKVVTDEHKAAAAGYVDASKAIDASGDPELVKFATSVVEQYVTAGRLTADFLRKKAAEEEEEEPKEPKPEGDKPAAGGGGGGPPPEMGSAPPDLVSQMQGGGGGGGGQDAEAQELLSLLAEMGMSPGELVALLKGGGPEAGGGMPPPDMGGATGMPPMPADGMMAGGGGGGTDADTAKMATQLLRLAEYTQKAAAHGQLSVVAASTPAKAAARTEIKKAIKDMINPRRRQSR